MYLYFTHIGRTWVWRLVFEYFSSQAISSRRCASRTKQVQKATQYIYIYLLQFFYSRRPVSTHTARIGRSCCWPSGGRRCWRRRSRRPCRRGSPEAQSARGQGNAGLWIYLNKSYHLRELNCFCLFLSLTSLHVPVLVYESMCAKGEDRKCN